MIRLKHLRRSGWFVHKLKLVAVFRPLLHFASSSRDDPDAGDYRSGKKHKAGDLPALCSNIS
jgi:hypothetical protein